MLICGESKILMINALCALFFGLERAFVQIFATLPAPPPTSQGEPGQLSLDPLIIKKRPSSRINLRLHLCTCHGLNQYNTQSLLEDFLAQAVRICLKLKAINSKLSLDYISVSRFDNTPESHVS